MTKFPQELADSFAALDYAQLSRVPYDAKVPVLKDEVQTILALRGWADSHAEPIEGWMEMYFDYVARMADDIEPATDTWTAYYELEGILRSFLVTMMQRQKQTSETVLQFGKALNDRLLLHPHGAIISGYVMSMLLDYADPLKTKFRLDDKAAEALYDVYALWIDTLFELAGRAKSDKQVYRLKMAIYRLEIEMRNIGNGKNRPAQLEPLMYRVLLFQLSVFDANGFINQEEIIEKIYDGPLGDVTLPEAGKLKEDAVRLFDSNRKEAVLYLLLNNLLTSLNLAADNSDEIRSYYVSGGNIGNVAGVSAFEKFLGLLCIYTNEANLIANYLKPYITTNDQLFVIASITGQDAYGIPAEQENVMHRIVLALIDPNLETPEQIAIKKLCIRWGVLDENALPEKYRFHAPKKLPSTPAELMIFYKALSISYVFRLGKKAPESNIPANFPEDIRDIYRLFNGTPDDRYFAELSDLEEIRRDIMYSYESDLEDADEEDIDPDDNNVDIRKHIHPGIIPIGQSYSGDSYFADPNCLSVTGHPIIIEYMHDEYLTGKLVANSLPEFLARHMIERFTEVNGPEKALLALLDTPVQIQS